MTLRYDFDFDFDFDFECSHILAIEQDMFIMSMLLYS